MVEAEVCVVCGGAAGGRLRAALWEEEEKGRLSARSAALCAACHAAFLAGKLSRADVALGYHRARGCEPPEWIGRVERDALLDISCLGCGALLPAIEPPPERLACARCGAVNHFAERLAPGGTTRLTAALDAAPRKEQADAPSRE